MHPGLFEQNQADRHSERAKKVTGAKRHLFLSSEFEDSTDMLLLNFRSVSVTQCRTGSEPQKHSERRIVLAGMSDACDAAVSGRAVPALLHLSGPSEQQRKANLASLSTLLPLSPLNVTCQAAPDPQTSPPGMTNGARVD